MKPVAIVGAFPLSLALFRGDLVSSIAATGRGVVMMSAEPNADTAAMLKTMPAQHVSYRVARSGLNPVNDLVTLCDLVRAFRKQRPTTLLCYTIKPVIWGGLAAFAIPRCRYFALITGLGYAFEGKGAKGHVLKTLVKWLYKIALLRAERVIFQNSDNRDVFIQLGIVRETKCAVVAGSGVNVERFTRQGFSATAPTFLMIARLLKAKGVLEYAKAACLVKKRFPEARFQLLGPTDPSPDAVSVHDIEQQADGAVEYLGSAADVRPFLANCHVYVLPSHHEGMPRTVLEAMATGRPILTTSASGCRETVVDGENGWKVDAGDWKTLAERMEWFLSHQDRWPDMADRSREMAKNKFDVKIVNQQMMSIMGLQKSPPAIEQPVVES